MLTMKGTESVMNNATVDNQLSSHNITNSTFSSTIQPPLTDAEIQDEIASHFNHLLRTVSIKSDEQQKLAELSSGLTTSNDSQTDLKPTEELNTKLPIVPLVTNAPSAELIDSAPISDKNTPIQTKTTESAINLLAPIRSKNEDFKSQWMIPVQTQHAAEVRSQSGNFSDEVKINNTEQFSQSALHLAQMKSDLKNIQPITNQNLTISNDVLKLFEKIKHAESISNIQISRTVDKNNSTNSEIDWRISLNEMVSLDKKVNFQQSKIDPSSVAIQQKVHSFLTDKLNLQISNNITEAKIRLDPPELGLIKINVSIDAEHKININLNSQSAQVRELLNSISERLRNDLHNNNMQMNVQVNVSNNNEEQNHRSTSNHSTFIQENITQELPDDDMENNSTLKA